MKIGIQRHLFIIHRNSWYLAYIITTLEVLELSFGHLLMVGLDVQLFLEFALAVVIFDSSVFHLTHLLKVLERNKLLFEVFLIKFIIILIPKDTIIFELFLE